VRRLLLLLVPLFLLLLLLPLFALVAAGSPAGGTTATPGSHGATPVIPPSWLTLYREAAATCPGLDWSVLAAIGTIESNSGQSGAPGVASGHNPYGAEGPMQFEPSTFAAFARTGPGGVAPPNPYDPVDAVYSAAAMLCADGAGGAGTLARAIWSYNHALAYVEEVSTLALALDNNAALTTTVATVLLFAAARLGLPYRWGGTGPGAYDCSGLVQAAFRSAGVNLPRVAQDQYGTGPAVPGSSAVKPGDLVFFGSAADTVEHVGIYAGSGLMIDAPHTGAVVRVEPAGWEGFVGATRPG